MSASQEPLPATQPTQPATPRPTDRRKWFLIGCGALVALSLVCGTIGGLIFLVSRAVSTPTAVVNRPAGTSIAGGGTLPTATTISGAGQASTARPTPTERPTPTPRPSPTPRPPTVTPTVLPTPATGKVGEQMAGQGYVMTVHQVQDPVPPQRYLQPEAGFRWIAVDVTIQNTGNAPLSYNPFYAKLKTADNREYNATLSAAEPGLQSGEQAPGETTRGWITFAIPVDAQLATLSYDPAFGRNRVQFDLRP